MKLKGKYWEVPLLPLLPNSSSSFTIFICFWFILLRSLYIVLCYADLLSCVRLFVTPRTVASQTPLSMGILQARIVEWVAMPSSRGSSQPRDQTQVPHTAGGFLTIWTTREALSLYKYKQIQIYSLLFPFLNKSGISHTLFWTLIFHLTLYHGHLSISYHRALPYFLTAV